MNMDMSPLFGFFNYCNSQLSNETDYSIAVTILNKLIKNENLSIESVAEDTLISQASVSRFVRKCGFKSWIEFRETLVTQLAVIKQEKVFLNENRYKSKTQEEICESVYHKSLNNIKATYDNLDLNKLNSIMDIISKAKSVSFLGDDHALSIFYILQLDILMSGIPAYLLKNEKIQEYHSFSQGKGDVIIYFTVWKTFLDDQKPRLNQIKKMHENGARTILFAQDDLGEIEDMFDIVYKYGIDTGVNDGYYSLFYICQIMSGMYNSKEMFPHF